MMFEKNKKTEAEGEETHPATKAAMAARAEPKAAPVPVESPLVTALRGLLAAGRHAPHCPAASHHLQSCGCGWGSAAAEAEELLGIPAERAAKAKAEDEKTKAADKALHAAARG